MAVNFLVRKHVAHSSSVSQSRTVHRWKDVIARRLVHWPAALRRTTRAATFAAAVACAGAAPPPLPAQLRMPPRPPDALTGSALCAQLAPLPVGEREEQLYREVARGNVPIFLRWLVPVELRGSIGGREHVLLFAAAPDYHAVGSDTDFIRMPMTPQLAQRLCNRFDCSLPTPRMVDAIWRQSDYRLVPQPIPASPEMVTVETFCRHNLMIEEQRRRAGAAAGLLLSGIKKDIVITPQLALRPPPPRVAIYGWHYPTGQPIQPLSLVHRASYADYSHGVRLVASDVQLDGQPRRLSDLLRDRSMAALVSDEGPFSGTPAYSIPAEAAAGEWILDREMSSAPPPIPLSDRLTPPSP